MKSTLTAGIFSFGILAAALAQTQKAELGPDVPAFTVRPGYRVDLVGKDLGEVRFLEFGPGGDLYVSQPRAGRIITLRQKDGLWTKVADFSTGKPTTHGMHYFDGWLWFTQSGAVWKARDTTGDGKADEEVKVLDGLPAGGGHWWRSILVTPGGFYTSIGDKGNDTDDTAAGREEIWKYSLDGKTSTLFASGLRNTEKLRLRPGTDELWGCDHGSDNWGAPFREKRGMQPFTDKIPPCEFNHYVQGGFYGHPYVVGNGLPRLEFKDRPDLLELAAKAISPEWCLGAHWAPNGWNFLQSDALGCKGDAVIACHGSWNSTRKVGYRLEHIVFDPVTNKPMGSQSLVSMLSADDKVLGRPCDVAEAADGSLLFSDDSKGRIYRLTAVK